MLLVHCGTSISRHASPDGMDLWSAVEPGGRTSRFVHRAFFFWFSTETPQCVRWRTIYKEHDALRIAGREIREAVRSVSPKKMIATIFIAIASYFSGATGSFVNVSAIGAGRLDRV